MTTVMDGHIVVDDRGIARVGQTRMKVTHLVQEMESEGLTAKQAAEAFPLTVADVHAALAYYHDHREEIDAQIRETAELVRRSEALFPKTITREELERRLAERSGQP